MAHQDRGITKKQFLADLPRAWDMQKDVQETYIYRTWEQGRGYYETTNYLTFRHSPFHYGRDSGSTVGRSNMRIIEKEFARAIKKGWLVIRSWDHRAYDLAIDTDKLPARSVFYDCLLEALYNIIRYPLLDDQDHSELEQEILHDNLDSWIVWEFRDELSVLLTDEQGEALDDAEDETIKRAILALLSEHYNDIEVIYEYAYTCHFDIDRLINVAGIDTITDMLGIA